jgi:hypothetical protein
MRSENTHPVAHPFNGEAFPLLAVFRFLRIAMAAHIDGEVFSGKNKLQSPI